MSRPPCIPCRPSGCHINTRFRRSADGSVASTAALDRRPSDRPTPSVGSRDRCRFRGRHRFDTGSAPVWHGAGTDHALLARSSVRTELSDRVTVETTGTALRDDRLVVTARIENPTRYRFRLTGVFGAVFTNGSRLVYGSDSFPDPIAIDARSTRTVEYSIPLSPEGQRRLRRAGTDASRGDVRLRTRYSLRLGETALVVRHTMSLDEPTRADEGGTAS